MDTRLQTMPLTRSSRKPKQKDDVEERDAAQSSERGPEQEVSKTVKDANRRSSRELRRRRRESMRSRNMGIGISIWTETTPNKKIVFDGDNAEEEPMDENDGIDGIEPTSKEVGVNQDEESDIDDDDAVEEVKSSVAREAIMEQREKERETVKEQKLQIRTKKRKKAAERKQLDENEFDEEFFAQVDSEMAAQRKQKREEKDSDSGPTGRHTTFVSAEEGETTGPIKADHSIEIVVLGDDGLAKSALLRSNEAKAGVEPTEASQFFARNRLANGKEQAKKKGTKKKKQDDPGWKRSKKMNVLAFGRAKVQRRKGCGTVAARFAVKS